MIKSGDIVVDIFSMIHEGLDIEVYNIDRDSAICFYHNASGKKIWSNIAVKRLVKRTEKSVSSIMRVE
jgi:hypothetical protein